MKNLIAIALTLFLTISCASVSKKDLENSKIVYEANTKGYYGKVIVENHTVSATRKRFDNDMKATKLSDAEWNELTKELKNINLEGISKLKAPSEARFYDGAAIANVTISLKGKTYESSPFDHGNPPAEIKNLVNKLVSFLNEN